ELQEGNRMLCDFVSEFEVLYYQRQSQRIHFVRQSAHLLTHLGPETVRAGPLSCYAQWTMETVIGNLGEEIRQDYDPYANISQRGLLRAQMNAIQSMLPDYPLVGPAAPPRGSINLGDGYHLLCACDKVLREVSPREATAIKGYWAEKGWPNLDGWMKAVKRWGRLQLPNGQIARSCWAENRTRRALRKTTVTKACTFPTRFKYYIYLLLQVIFQNRTQFMDIQYFFRLSFGDTVHTLALASMFSPPNLQLLQASFQVVYECHHQGDQALVVFDAKEIQSVVAMVPSFQISPDGQITRPETKYFMIEKPGLDIATALGIVEDGEDGDDDIE
ncbi:hypothetical protein BD779DRAFT_1450538, partial [Infundibulicybe gibba]